MVNVYREFKKYKTSDAAESESMSEQKARFRNFLQEWSAIMGKYDEMYVLGDFNIDFSVPRYKPMVDIINKLILSKGFQQVITEPTFANTRGDISLILTTSTLMQRGLEMLLLIVVLGTLTTPG